MIAHQRRHRLTAAFKGHVTHFVRIHFGLLRQQRGFHPVLAADRGACANHHAVRIFFHGGQQIFQGFPRGVRANGDHAVIGAYGGEPAHVIYVITTKFPLRQVQQRAAGEGHHGAGFSRALGDDGVIGYRAHAAGHVGDAHRFLNGLRLQQADLNQLTGQVKAAAGFGRGDTLGAGRGVLRLDDRGTQQQYACSKGRK